MPPKGWKKADHGKVNKAPPPAPDPVIGPEEPDRYLFDGIVLGVHAQMTGYLNRMSREGWDLMSIHQDPRQPARWDCLFRRR